ncbi:MAG: hypothetical protein ABSF99_10605 [Anaerolineales bacterium]|jgi:hypothetical protein
MKFNYGKIFLLGFGFFGVSFIWGVYNAFVPNHRSGFDMGCLAWRSKG